jgi:hypothetical protein
MFYRAYPKPLDFFIARAHNRSKQATKAEGVYFGDGPPPFTYNHVTIFPK